MRHSGIFFEGKCLVGVLKLRTNHADGIFVASDLSVEQSWIFVAMEDSK